MNRLTVRAAGLLPAVWLGVLLCVALIATPAGFALLPRSQAGALAGRILGQEAILSLAMGAVLLLLDRWSARQAPAGPSAGGLNRGTLLILGTLFCTVLGYFALQGPMADARAGQGRLTFAQLHGLSLAAYGLKVVLVAALAWRGAGGRPGPAAPIASPARTTSS